VSESLVLHHVTHLEHVTKIHCYHHQWSSRQYCNVQHVHLYDLDRWKTAEPANLFSAQPFEITNRIPVCM
jgi:hypothetical protein